MPTIAYLANQFPVGVEPYVASEIQELGRRGIHVIACSARTPESGELLNWRSEPEVLCLQDFRLLAALRSVALLLLQRKQLAGLLARIFLQGRESPYRRLKALVHIWLGAYYAVLLKDRGVDHIHAHHGYFGSWIALVAARLLGAGFSLTLHGSDLLIDGAYLDTKLSDCQFCITISDYNRRYILRQFPNIDPTKILVSRLGVDSPARAESTPARHGEPTLTLLAVGRLHAVKDHAFLIRACACLRDCGIDFRCMIAGEGPERKRLESMIQLNRLQNQITLLGHLDRAQIESRYRSTGMVVLTSRSEGIPLVLMEAMARSKIVLAPSITGIPELVIPGKTGFLYEPASLEDFLAKILFIRKLLISERPEAVRRLNWIRYAARTQILHNFDRQENLTHFGGQFLQRITKRDLEVEPRSPPHENLVLQQI